MAKFDQKLTKHIAHLAKIPIGEKEAKELTKAFKETLKVVDELQKLNVKDTEPTHQVTGLSNVWREDKIQEEQMFSQEEALANAPKKYHGYFVVERIIDQE